MRTLFLITFLTTFVTQATAQDFLFDENQTAESLKSLEVKVVLSDYATGACWTNLKEVREYAEEKLRGRGIKVSDTEYMQAEYKTYWFNIIVSARRFYEDGSGPCLGRIGINLKGWAYINNIRHKALLGEADVSLVTPENFNRYVIINLEKVFASFP